MAVVQESSPEKPVAVEKLPGYAVFDDFRYSQRIAVMVRWVILGAWLFLLNYRNPDINKLVTLNGLGMTLAALNGYVHWRIWRGRPVSRGYVIALSSMDLVVITVGIAVTTGFANTYFVFYYPALLGIPLVFSSRRLSFLVTGIVAIAYAAISIFLEPGVDVDEREEAVLITRIVIMFGVVMAANIMARIERTMRREAVAAERERSHENLELQRKAQAAEIAALSERSRIAREIHDGVAQSIYMLSLNLETAVELAAKKHEDLPKRLDSLVSLSKSTLLEVRHYIYDLKPYLEGEQSMEHMLENIIREFRTVAGVDTALETKGEERHVPISVATALYRLTQEVLANAFKHAEASKVSVGLEFLPDGLRLTVHDDGRGFNVEESIPGHDLTNMRQRTEELEGKYTIESAPGQGTHVSVWLPT
ncbi:MAG: sensor histidine kinase [Chloroflexi bacterium]|nr:sensor histidine kinase [Chloroflexota bacterium]